MLFVFLINVLQDKSLANKYFSIYLINISVTIFLFLLIEIDFDKFGLFLLPFQITSLLLIGPILWLFVNSVTGERKKNIYPHLILPLLTGAFALILYVLTFLVKDPKSVLRIKILLLNLSLSSIVYGVILINVFYIYKSLKLYKRHLNRVGDVYSYTEKVNLSWLKPIIYGYIVFVLAWVLPTLISDMVGIFWSDIVHNCIVLGYIIFCGYTALKHQPIIIETIEKGDDNKNVEIDLQSPFFIELKDLLLKGMEEEKLYLDPSLTINSLAKELNTNGKYLSQLINNEFNKSFVVFINEYRIEEVKKMLLDRQNNILSIEGIGYEAGFKSKSAFNVAFKKYTGETPSVFLKQMLK